MTLGDLFLVWIITSLISVAAGYIWISSLRNNARTLKSKINEAMCGFVAATCKVIFYFAVFQAIVTARIASFN